MFGYLVRSPMMFITVGMPAIDLAALVVGCVVDRVCGDLRLIDGRHRHRLLWQLGASPRELSLFDHVLEASLEQAGAKA